MVPRTHRWCKAGVSCLWQRSRKLPHARDSRPIQERGLAMGGTRGRAGNLIIIYILNWVGSSGFLASRESRNAEKVPLQRLRFAVLGLDWGWNKRMRSSHPTPQALHQEISSSCLLLEAWQGRGSRLPPRSHTHTPITRTRMCTASCTFRVDHKYWERLFDAASKVNIFGIVFDLKNLCRVYSFHIHTT